MRKRELTLHETLARAKRIGKKGYVPGVVFHLRADLREEKRWRAGETGSHVRRLGNPAFEVGLP